MFVVVTGRQQFLFVAGRNEMVSCKKCKIRVCSTCEECTRCLQCQCNGNPVKKKRGRPPAQISNRRNGRRKSKEARLVSPIPPRTIVTRPKGNKQHAIEKGIDALNEESLDDEGENPVANTEPVSFDRSTGDEICSTGDLLHAFGYVEVAELWRDIVRNSEMRNGATANPMDVYGRMRQP